VICDGLYVKWLSYDDYLRRKKHGGQNPTGKSKKARGKPTAPRGFKPRESIILGGKQRAEG
jgi:hypothetical protein